jgi:hypothetical protein
MRLIMYPILTNTEIAKKNILQILMTIHSKSRLKKRSGPGTCFGHFF